MTDDAQLLAALAVIQARGAIGERSLVDAVAHADRFVSLIPDDAATVVDLGSGGGLPALVIAWRRPDVRVTMVERRATRADLLRRAVISLGLGEQTIVRDEDVAKVAADSERAFDVVTARSFADVQTTSAFIDRLLAEGGVALVSEPPDDRSAAWAAVLADFPTLADTGVYQGIRQLSRVGSSV
ncbi:MAG TPA: RsmG family class I SAM-dependent methyltransferase [Ilumatobacteraceae bacterium]|jgi:16S rRNA (guanine527-N7)-methyltransferase|nr:RsmG family class I SAM-dependent methyltransferase [Ilumatobacteraceae bacterium]